MISNTTSTKSEFGIMCRELRVRNGLKQRQVAAAMGVKLSTYGNLESSHWKVVSREKAARLVEFYKLPLRDGQALLEAWDRCPLSAHGEKRKAMWDKTNALRSKAKNHDQLKLALLGALGVLLMEVPEDRVCSCEFGAPACPVCFALERLGLDAYTPADREKILTQLARQQSALAPAAESSSE